MTSAFESSTSMHRWPRMSAWIRGPTGMAAQDAIHVASARASGATVFITDDRRILALPRLGVAVLDDLVA